MVKRSSFKTKRGIKIRRQGFVEKLSGNNLAKIKPNWSSGCRLGVENVRTTHQKFTFEKKRKVHFLRRLASNEIMTPIPLIHHERCQLIVAVLKHAPLNLQNVNITG